MIAKGIATRELLRVNAKIRGGAIVLKYDLIGISVKDLIAIAGIINTMKEKKSKKSIKYIATV